MFVLHVRDYGKTWKIDPMCIEAVSGKGWSLLSKSVTLEQEQETKDENDYKYKKYMILCVHLHITTRQRVSKGIERPTFRSMTFPAMNIRLV